MTDEKCEIITKKWSTGSLFIFQNYGILDYRRTSTLDKLFSV